MSKVDYSVIRAEYVAGSMTLASLALKHGISRVALERRATRGGWNDARRALSLDVQRFADHDLVNGKKETIAEVNAASLSIARAIRDKVFLLLELSERPGAELTAADLRTLAAVAESTQRVARLALGSSTAHYEHQGTGVAIVETYDPLERIKRRIAEMEDGGLVH